MRPSAPSIASFTCHNICETDIFPQRRAAFGLERLQPPQNLRLVLRVVQQRHYFALTVGYLMPS